MTDLLQQAVDEMPPRWRAECNAALAFSQNCHNVETTAHFYEMPDMGVVRALEKFHRREIEMAAYMWDQGYTVKGLS